MANTEYKVDGVRHVYCETCLPDASYLDNVTAAGRLRNRGGTHDPCEACGAESIDIVSIDEIRNHARGHFFDAGANRFFRSRYPQTGWRKGGKAYFVTSEQFVDSEGRAARRAYTVRVLDYGTGDVDTAGDFNKLTRSQAQTQVKHILAN